MKATKAVYIKQSNLDIIKSTIEGSKIKAYERLLDKKGSPISKGRYKGAKMIYIGNDDYIGAIFTKYNGGYTKVEFLTGKID